MSRLLLKCDWKNTAQQQRVCALNAKLEPPPWLQIRKVEKSVLKKLLKLRLVSFHLAERGGAQQETVCAAVY